MEDAKYEVLIDEKVIAKDMELHIALILTRAVFEEYYNDHSMTVSLREMARCEGCENDAKERD